MKLVDFNKLKKCMGLTVSDNDHEALSALRAANAILVREKLTWDRVLSKTITVLTEVEDVNYAQHAHDVARSQRQENNEIDEAFEVLADADLGDFSMFIFDVKRQWKKHRSLSERQVKVLLKAADRERKKRDR